MTEAQALHQLEHHPLDFLKKNALTPYAAPGVSGLHTFYMVDTQSVVKRPGSILGKLKKHNTQRFQVRANAIMGGMAFQALHVPVQPSNIAINPLPLMGLGSNLMITTQLTGCCIVMVPVMGSYSVAHLQPTMETGMQVQTRLKALGLKVYGANDYTVNRAMLLGVRQGGIWNFYTQIQDANFNVLSAKKLPD